MNSIFSIEKCNETIVFGYAKNSIRVHKATSYISDVYTQILETYSRDTEGKRPASSSRSRDVGDLTQPTSSSLAQPQLPLVGDGNDDHLQPPSYPDYATYLSAGGGGNHGDGDGDGDDYDDDDEEKQIVDRVMDEIMNKKSLDPSSIKSNKSHKIPYTYFLEIQLNIKLRLILFIDCILNVLVALNNYFKTNVLLIPVEHIDIFDYGTIKNLFSMDYVLHPNSQNLLKILHTVILGIYKAKSVPLPSILTELVSKIKYTLQVSRIVVNMQRSTNNKNIDKDKICY